MKSVRSLALLASVAFALPACTDGAESPAVSAPPVMVETVVGTTLVERIESTGELIAVDEVSVAAEVGGRVTGLLVKEGDAVDEGQPILEIDPEKRELELKSERARLAEAQQNIEMTEREAKRRRNLHSKNATSQAVLDEAETALASARSRFVAAQAQLGLAQRALQDASVTAPFRGLIARRHVGVGSFVRPGDPLFDLVALDPIEVEFHLTERDSGRVSQGDVVEVRVAPYPEEVFRGVVTVISPRIDPRTRTLRVKAAIDNTDGRLRPGTFARADLGVAERADVAMIPEDAVLQRSDGAVVYRLAGANRVERRNVRLGAFRDGMIEAIDGVGIGDRVVVRGQARLIDGAAVDVRRRDGSLDGPSVADAKDAEGVPLE